MSILNSPPITIVQMGHVEKIVEAAQNQPVLQQQVTQEEAARLLREKQVDPSQRPEETSDVKTKDKEGGSGSGFRQKKKRRRPESESSEASIPDSPTAGIFVNKKV